jgi:hypothetical protein
MTFLSRKCGLRDTVLEARFCTRIEIHADFIVIHLVAVSDCECRLGAVAFTNSTAIVYSDA